MDKLDILNREKFVEQLIRLTENISANKKSTSFAINGAWGCGKSFILDMYEERLSPIQNEETADDRYFIIRYNCWKYDYYEEPLIAIVATLLGAIKRDANLLSDEQKSKVKAVIKTVGVTALSLVNDTLKNKTGVDIKNEVEIIRNEIKEDQDDYKNNHDYDKYFVFNKVMDELICLLRDLSKDYTVVFIVDELDRCLPEYAVKVLERLHHLTEEQSNIVTIIAIDKKQLMTGIKHIFGFENPAKYLEKFISFEVKLDNGDVSKKIIDKYTDYIELFDKDIFPFDDPVEECLQAIFKDVDIRTQEQLVKKAMTAHKLLYTDKKDYSFMCMELLLVVMIYIYDYNTAFTENPVKIKLNENLNRVFQPYASSPRPAFADFFEDKFNAVEFGKELWVSNVVAYILPAKASLYGVILYSWYFMHLKYAGATIEYRFDIYKNIDRNHEELKKFAETIKMMQ